MLTQNIFDKPYNEYTILWNKSCVQQELQDGDTCSHRRLNQISLLFHEEATIDITTRQLLTLKDVLGTVYGSPRQNRSLCK
jgi:hypothetical protein